MTRFEQYLDALRKPVIKLAQLEFLHPDQSINFVVGQDLISDGALNVSLNNGVRRTATVTLVNTDGDYDFAPDRLWFGQQVRLSMGLRLPDGTDYYIPQGVFYIKDPINTFQPARKAIQLNLVDKWAYLDGTLNGYLEAIHEIPLTSNIFLAMQRILDEPRGNGLVIDDIQPLFTHFYNDRTTELQYPVTIPEGIKIEGDIVLPDSSMIPGGTITTSEIVLPAGTMIPWLLSPYTARKDSLNDSFADLLLELNTMLVGLIGYNANGQLQVDPSQDSVYDTDKPILWDFSLDEPEFLGATYTLNNTQVYNDIIVEGKAIDEGDFTPRVQLTNYDIRSPYNVQTIGRKTKPRSETTSEQYVTEQQCEDIGRWLLKRDTLMRESVSISSSQMFHLHENGLVTLRRPDKGGTLERHLITGYNIPMGMSAMTINATSVNDLPDLALELKTGFP